MKIPFSPSCALLPSPIANPNPAWPYNGVENIMSIFKCILINWFEPSTHLIVNPSPEWPWNEVENTKFLFKCLINWFKPSRHLIVNLSQACPNFGVDTYLDDTIDSNKQCWSKISPKNRVSLKPEDKNHKDWLYSEFWNSCSKSCYFFDSNHITLKAYLDDPINGNENVEEKKLLKRCVCLR